MAQITRYSTVDGHTVTLAVYTDFLYPFTVRFSRIAYTGWAKLHLKLMAIILSNLNRFSKSFHWKIR